MKLLKVKLFAVAMVVFAATSAFADYSFDFNVNTSSIAGESGYIDLQFNPGAYPAGAANAVIANWTSDGTLGNASTISTSGNVSGTLPGGVTITSTPTSQYNDYNHALTFGNSISFNLNLSGAYGNSFALSFFGSDDATPLLTTDSVNGYAATIDLNQNGPAVTNSSNQLSVVEGTPAPIPPSILLMGSGLLGFIGLKRKCLG